MNHPARPQTTLLGAKVFGLAIFGASIVGLVAPAPASAAPANPSPASAAPAPSAPAAGPAAAPPLTITIDDLAGPNGPGSPTPKHRHWQVEPDGGWWGPGDDFGDSLDDGWLW